ncbi:hypothetical protein ACOSQ3_011751 [Xanthoceras sorbifolium]
MIEDYEAESARISTRDSFKSNLMNTTSPSSWTGFGAGKNRLKIVQGDITVSEGPSGLKTNIRGSAKKILEDISNVVCKRNGKQNAKVDMIAGSKVSKKSSGTGFNVKGVEKEESGSGIVKGKGRFELKLGSGLGKGKKKIATQNSNHDDGMVEDLADSEVLQFFHQDMMVAMATDTHNNQDGEAARMQEDIRDGNPINTNADQVVNATICTH